METSNQAMQSALNQDYIPPQFYGKFLDPTNYRYTIEGDEVKIPVW